MAEPKIQIKVRHVSRLSEWSIQTDDCHDGADALVYLFEAEFASVNFTDAGYNISVTTAPYENESVGIKDVKKRAESIIWGYYAPKDSEPFCARIVPGGAHSLQRAIQANRRLPRHLADLVYELRQLPGVSEIVCNNGLNNSRIVVSVPNDFFDADEVAQLVIDTLTGFAASDRFQLDELP